MEVPNDEWRYRLTVRTDGSQPSNRGSIPRTATRIHTFPLIPAPAVRVGADARGFFCTMAAVNRPVAVRSRRVRSLLLLPATVIVFSSAARSARFSRPRRSGPAGSRRRRPTHRRRRRGEHADRDRRRARRGRLDRCAGRPPVSSRPSPTRASPRPKPPKSESCSTPTRCTSASVVCDQLGQAADHQRHSEGLHARRAGQLRGRARHVRRSPQRLRVRHQPGGREIGHADRQRRPRRQHQLGRRVDRRDARCDEDGWTAEIRIPFKTLRFERGAGQIWGVNFSRRIRRNNEVDYWSPVPRVYNLYRVSLAGTLERASGRGPGTQPAREAVGRGQRDACAGGEASTATRARAST